MMIKKYIYNGCEYASEYEVRQAIFEKDRVVFGKPQSEDEWLKFGVTIAMVEIPEPEEYTPSFDELKNEKLNDLEVNFESYRNSHLTHLISSLGFKVNSNVTAFNNVTGLIAQLEVEGDGATVGFMTFDDELVSLNIEQLKIILVEISKHGSFVYQQKWELRNQIENATDVDSLNAIEIKFESVDFREV